MKYLVSCRQTVKFQVEISGVCVLCIVSSGDKYSEFVTEGVMANTVGVLLITLAVTVVFIITNPNYKRQPLPEEETIPLTN